MCDNCKNVELEGAELGEDCENEEMNSDSIFMEVEVNKELDRISREVIFDKKTLKNAMTSDEFLEGCKDANYFCGMYSSMINFGISSKFAEDCVMNQMTIRHNILTGDMANKTNIAVSKNQLIVAENNPNQI